MTTAVYKASLRKKKSNEDKMTFANLLPLSTGREIILLALTRGEGQKMGEKMKLYQVC